jgi:hypothetical protein
MKKTLTMICVATVFSLFVNVCGVFAFGSGDAGLIKPAVDLDFVFLQNKQSKTVTSDLSFPMDFEIIPVMLVGAGNFSASLSRTSTTGEMAYICLYVLRGFGNPVWDYNYGLTPLSLRVNTSISDDSDPNVTYVLVVHGILFSTEAAPYEYNVSLSF